MKQIWTKAWLEAALCRAARTFAQTAAAMISTGAMLSEISWGTVASTAAVAAVMSLLMSLSGLPETEEDHGQAE